MHSLVCYERFSISGFFFFFFFLGGGGGGAGKVSRKSEKCLKVTRTVNGGYLKGTKLSITAPDYFSRITSRRLAHFLVDLY